MSTKRRDLVGRPVQDVRVRVVAGPSPTHDEGSGARVTVGTAHGNSVVLADPTVSRFHVELSRGPRGIHVQDLSSTNGTYLGSAWIQGSGAVIAPGTQVRVGATTLLVDDGSELHVQTLGAETLCELIGRSAPMQRLFGEIRRVAPTSASVTIRGESGSGKELVARAIHTLSGRSSGPLVVLDCGALAPHVMASELFGHERGAFTGAERRRVGAFETASGGTLFLDEIGELSRDHQAALLGVLERKTIRRVGGSEDIAIDARLVSATHRDLRADVNAGRFRLDLYYRLAVVELTVPPLRDRREDIPLIVQRFVDRLRVDDPTLEADVPAIVSSVADRLFPGNVRELRNTVEAQVLLGSAAYPRPVSAGAQSHTGLDATIALAPLPSLSYREARERVTDAFERYYVERIVRDAGGNVKHAATTAKMDRSYLIQLLTKHGLK